MMRRSMAKFPPPRIWISRFHRCSIPRWRRKASTCSPPISSTRRTNSRRGKGIGTQRRGELANIVIKDAARAIRPNLANLVEAAHVITPQDLETTYGFTGGHIFHGELALDQIFTMRPVIDWARYQTPVKACTSAATARIPETG